MLARPAKKSRQLRFFFTSFGLFLGLFSEPASAKLLITKKDDVQVFEKAVKDSKVVATFKKGETLDASERKGMYWELNLASGGKGYVSIMLVDIKKGDESSGLSSALRSAVQNRRSEDDPNGVRERSTVMGVRGLDDSSEVNFAGNAKPNLRMVYQMESLLVPSKKIDELDKQVQQELEAKLQTSQ
ncbi:MAG: hypothetical protein KA436_11085 [Oligoflexales bacterium]|nr:hypothetical protein [Oligoflexales bacterium]